MNPASNQNPDATPQPIVARAKHPRRTISMVVSAIVLIALGIWFFQPTPGYDLEQVTPLLRSLQTPYQSVKASYELTQKDVFIEIVDATGKRGQFEILGGTNQYGRIMCGAELWQAGSQVAARETEPTKRMLIAILAQEKQNPGGDLPLVVLRRLPQDMVRFAYYKWKYKL